MKVRNFIYTHRIDFFHWNLPLSLEICTRAGKPSKALSSHSLNFLLNNRTDFRYWIETSSKKSWRRTSSIPYNRIVKRLWLPATRHPLVISGHAQPGHKLREKATTQPLPLLSVWGVQTDGIFFPQRSSNIDNWFQIFRNTILAHRRQIKPNYIKAEPRLQPSTFVLNTTKH